MGYESRGERVRLTVRLPLEVMSALEAAPAAVNEVIEAAVREYLELPPVMRPLTMKPKAREPAKPKPKPEAKAPAVDTRYPPGSLLKRR